MKWVSGWALFIFPIALQAEAEKVKLLKIQALAEGAVVTEWEKISTSSQEILNNSIFVLGLPDTVASGDIWEGFVVRDGAYTTDKGVKIPKYSVSDNSSQEKKAKNGDFSQNVYFVKSDKGSGTAFLCTMRDQGCLLTTLESLYGAQTIQIFDSNGKSQTLPSEIDISEDGSIVRIFHESKSGLKIADEIQVKETVFVYNKNNKTKNQKSEAEVTSANGPKMELTYKTSISPESIIGDAPILNTSGELLGITAIKNIRECLWWDAKRVSERKTIAVRILPAKKWTTVSLQKFQKDSSRLYNIEKALEQIMDLSVLFRTSHLKMPTLNTATNERMRAQNKVKLAVESAQNKKLKETQQYWLFFTSLAEACELVIEENREFWETSWAGDKFKLISDLGNQYANEIRKFRDKAGWSVYW